MTLRPFYRWKSFWLGLLVLAFLSWVWVRSLSRTEGVRVVCGLTYYIFQLSDGVVRVERWDGLKAMGSVPLSYDASWFSVFLRPEDVGVQEEWEFFTPNLWTPDYVTLIAFPVSGAFHVFLATWAGWLLGYGRRRLSRLTEVEVGA